MEGAEELGLLGGSAWVWAPQMGRWARALLLGLWGRAHLLGSSAPLFRVSRCLRALVGFLLLSSRVICEAGGSLGTLLSVAHDCDSRVTTSSPHCISQDACTMTKLPQQEQEPTYIRGVCPR